MSNILPTTYTIPFFAIYDLSEPETTPDPSQLMMFLSQKNVLP